MLKSTRIGFAAISLLSLLVVYALFDPALESFFPPCPFHSLTGFLCPGCGSQRALHHLINLRPEIAFSYNPLLIISIPYVLAGAFLDHYSSHSSKVLKWRQFFFGRRAIFLVLFIIISFWILRNL